MLRLMRREFIPTVAVLAAVTGLGLAGCGSGEGNDHDHQQAAPAPAQAGQATKADFHVLSTAPPGSEHMAGTAILTRHGNTATVSASVTGLPAGQKFMAHIHAQPCSVDSGGGHFKFDPNGPATPPNEVHLSLTADPSGAANSSVEVDRELGEGAKSLVVHNVDTKKMLCADF